MTCHLFNVDVIKYFGCELGAQTKYDKKVGTSIVNGAHDQAKLAEVLESFIKKYVQCYGCGNPETVVKIKRDNIYLKCKACGHVSHVDPGLKLNTFIIKNPPENKLSKAEKKVKKAEKERLKGLEDGAKEDKKLKKKKSSKKSEKDAPTDEKSQEQVVEEEEVEEEDDEEEDDVVWMTDTSAEAMQQRAEEQLSGATAKMVTQGNLEAERAAAKKREEKRRAAEEQARIEAEEQAKLEAEAAKMKIDDPIASIKEALNPVDMKALKDAVDGISGKEHNKMQSLYQALFDGIDTEAKLAVEFRKRIQILDSFAQTPTAQVAQLMAFESLIATTKYLKVVGPVLKLLFDEDVIDEELIIGWYEKATIGSVLGVSNSDAKEIRAAAEELVTWLEEAESESDEE